jgi:hypothetical protein
MTQRFSVVLRAVHDGLGTAHDLELVVPSVFGPELVGSQTLLPALRARVSLENPRTADDLAREISLSAWAGEILDMDPSYTQLLEAFLASLVDLPPGAEVGFSAPPTPVAR